MAATTPRVQCRCEGFEDPLDPRAIAHQRRDHRRRDAVLDEGRHLLAARLGGPQDRDAIDEFVGHRGPGRGTIAPGEGVGYAAGHVLEAAPREEPIVDGRRHVSPEGGAHQLAGGFDVVGHADLEATHDLVVGTVAPGLGGPLAVGAQDLGQGGAWEEVHDQALADLAGQVEHPLAERGHVDRNRGGRAEP